MRVYCHTHKRSFSVEATTPIVCDKGPHPLGATPNDETSQDIWEYCCNCENFWRINPDEPALGQCPVCERVISARHLCAHCQTLTLDSSAPAKRREFRLSLEGAPLPSCPGCSQTNERPLLEHECEAFAAAFTTARSSCPFCHEEVAVGLSFPASVANYLNQFTGDKVEAAFDAESRQLVRTSPGEFLLLQTAKGAQLNFALPGLTRFDSRNEFFKYYKDYYDCDEPAAGEVIVLSPATVRKEGKGWSLQTTGRLRVNTAEVTENLEQSQSTSATAPLADNPYSATVAVLACSQCGATAKPSHKFCKKCGAAIHVQESVALGNLPLAAVPNAAAVQPSPAAPEAKMNSAPDLIADSFEQGKSKAWIVLAVLAGVALVIGLVFVSSKKSTPSIESKLDDAIVRNNLIAPPGGSAYDYYSQLQGGGASPATLAAYKERILPRLVQRPQELLDGVIRPGGNDGSVSEWEEAQKLLAWAVELKPGDQPLAAKAAYCEGRTAYLKSRIDEAMSAYQRAADLDKTWATPLNSLGAMLNEHRRYSEARGYLTEAIRRNPNWALPYNNMGTSYFLENNIYDAQPNYQKARDLAPDWARPHAWLGSIALKQKDYCTAVDEFEQALKYGTPTMSSWNPQRIQRDLDEARAHCVGD
jgi:hypothetical protein